MDKSRYWTRETLSHGDTDTDRPIFTTHLYPFMDDDTPIFRLKLKPLRNNNPKFLLHLLFGYKGL